MKTKYDWTRTPRQAFMDGSAIIKISHYVSRLVYLEAMWEMEEKYPDMGWKEQAKALEKWYDDHEIPRTVGEKPDSQLEFKVGK